MEDKSTRGLKIILLFLVIALLILFIFFFSEQSGGESFSLSKRIAASVANDWNELFSLKMDDASLSMLTHILNAPIRKLAHVIEYFILGFGTYGTIFLLNKRRSKLLPMILSLLLVMFVANMDELNQFFSGGRGSSVRDVIIDTTGGALGIYMVVIINDLCRHIKNCFNRKKS